MNALAVFFLFVLLYSTDDMTRAKADKYDCPPPPPCFGQRRHKIYTTSSSDLTPPSNTFDKKQIKVSLYGTNASQTNQKKRRNTLLHGKKQRIRMHTRKTNPEM